MKNKMREERGRNWEREVWKYESCRALTSQFTMCTEERPTIQWPYCSAVDGTMAPFEAPCTWSKWSAVLSTGQAHKRTKPRVDSHSSWLSFPLLTSTSSQDRVARDNCIELRFCAKNALFSSLDNVSCVWSLCFLLRLWFVGMCLHAKLFVWTAEMAITQRILSENNRIETGINAKKKTLEWNTTVGRGEKRKNLSIGEFYQLLGTDNREFFGRRISIKILKQQQKVEYPLIRTEREK